MQPNAYITAQYEWNCIDKHARDDLGESGEMVIIETIQGADPQKNPTEELECIVVKKKNQNGDIVDEAMLCGEPNESLDEEEIQDFVEEFGSS